MPDSVFSAWPAPADAPHWGKAFTDGAEVELYDGRSLVLRRSKVGEVETPSGRLVACDPVMAAATEPLPLGVEAGPHSVFISEADEADPHVVAAAVVLSEHVPVRWSRTPYFDVGSSLFAFFDAESAESIEQRLEDHWAAIQSRLDASQAGWIEYSVGDTPRMVLGIPGFGDDGSYVGYIGWDAHGAAAAAVVGFGFLPDDEVRDGDKAATVVSNASDEAYLALSRVESLLRNLYTSEGPVKRCEDLDPSVELAWGKGALARGPEAVLETLRNGTRGGLDLQRSGYEPGVVEAAVRDRASGRRLGKVTVGYSPDPIVITRLAFEWEAEPAEAGAAVIPDLSGFTESEALAALHLEGFSDILPATRECEAPPETVVATCPPAGVSWALSGTVEIVLARPRNRTVEVPDLTGLPEEEARELIEALGLFLVISAERSYRSDVEPSTVVAQHPEAGDTRTTGTSVEVTLTADDRVELLDLVGCDVDEAEMRLDIIGLKKGKVRKQKGSDRPKGTVLETQPPAGSKLARGSKVGLVVAG